jgi:APA family basic amino acid/polyamine antiporter
VTGPDLRRGLGVRDGILLTIGSVVGSGIFLTPGSVARAVPHAGLLLVVWLLGGLITLAGALTLAELGVLFPRAGGQYHFLKEAYGPLFGFLFGWTAFLVIMSGGIAAIAVAFAEFAAAFVPAFSGANVLWSVPLGGATWTVDGRQACACLAILVLTIVNHFGLGAGAGVQGAMTAIKVAAIVALAAFGFAAEPRAVPDLLAPTGAATLPGLMGAGMIAVLWSYDGWNAVTYSAGELRDPARALPRSIVAGTASVVVLYLLLNLVYLRALPLGRLAESAHVAEEAAAALFAPGAARLVTIAILVSILGCLASTILYSSRIYLPMARDGVFFRTVAHVHPRYRVPDRSLWFQSAWAIALALSGTYEQLFTFVTFAVVVFNGACGAAVLVLRRTRPDLPRPYRVPGYPFVPALFVLASAMLAVNAVVETPRESLAGLAIIALGVPAYAWWRGRRGSGGAPPAGEATGAAGRAPRSPRE